MCNSDANNTTEVSVVVLTYNPTWKELSTTLKSIIAQRDCVFEVIIADDGSENNLGSEIREFFEKRGFSNYKLIQNKTNVGTVKNLLSALCNCNSEYVKDLGQGDVLYDNHTLKKMYDYLKNGELEFVFGRPVPFSINEKGLHMEQIADDRASISNADANIKRNCFLYEEYPHGATFFFKRDVMIKYLEEIKDVVVYCEDLSIRLMILDGVKIKFLDEFVAFYECAIGISHSKGGLSRVEKDCLKFSNYFDKSDRENKPSRHIKNLATLRLRKKLSRRRVERTFYQVFTGIVDIRIPINKVVRKVHRRQLKKPEYRMLYECYGDS